MQIYFLFNLGDKVLIILRFMILIVQSYWKIRSNVIVTCEENLKGTSQVVMIMVEHQRQRESDRNA